MEKRASDNGEQNRFTKRVAIFIAIAGVVLGLTTSLFAVRESFGGWVTLLGLVFFPFTFAYFPFYTLFTDGNWNLLLLNYGSIAASWILLYIPEREKWKSRSAIDEPPTQPVVTKDTPSPTVILIVIVGILFAVTVCALSIRAIW